MRNRRQAALMAMQHVDRQSHPYTLVFLLHTLTGSYRLLQPLAAFLAGELCPVSPSEARSYAAVAERSGAKPAPLLPFCTINSSLHCFGSGDT